MAPFSEVVYIWCTPPSGKYLHHTYTISTPYLHSNSVRAPTTGSTATPTTGSTVGPSMALTVGSTVAPNTGSTAAPTAAPTVAPTAAPTVAPTAGSTVAPTATSTSRGPSATTLLTTACSLICANGGILDVARCQCNCVQSWDGPTCSNCPLSASSCTGGRLLSAEFCECFCPTGISGDACNVPDPCGASPPPCSQPGQYCLMDSQVPAGYRCLCQELDGYFFDTNARCTRQDFKSITVVVVILGVNGVPVVFRQEYNDPFSAATRELLQIIASVIQHELSLFTPTRDFISIRGILLREGSLVFTGVIQARSDSSIAASSVSQVLNSVAAARPLTGGTNTLNVNQGVTAMDSTTACPSNYCQNGGTCDVSGRYPLLTYSCRCATAFTGAQCDSLIPLPPLPVMTTTMSPAPGNGLSTAAIIGIVSGAFLVFLLVVLLFACLLLMNHSGVFGRPPLYQYPVYRPPRMWDDYGYEVSPDTQKDNLLKDFSRPYYVDGREARRYYTPETIGGHHQLALNRVVYNPGFEETNF